MRLMRVRSSLCFALAFACIGAAAAQPRTTLTLTFVGDLMTHPALSGMADYADVYRGVADVLQGSDLAFANLEFPVDSTRPSTGYPLFNAHVDYVRAAAEAGINVFSAANNHAFDGGEEGLFETMCALTSLDGPRRSYFSGIRGNTSRPFLPQAIMVNGVRVGFIAVTQFLNQGDDGSRYVHVVDYDSAEQARQFEQFVRETSALFDVSIVSYHGGQEYKQEPSAARRAFFHRLVQNGATIVFAHHSHVLQEHEMVTVGSSTRLIMYSMGNFISGMARSAWPPDPDGLDARLMESAMLRVQVGVEAGGASVTGVQAIPIVNYRDEKGGLEVLRLDDVADGKVQVPRSWKAYFLAQRVRLAASPARQAAGAAR
jgi:Bacterial capsule synthesis protein PGA_cap